MKVPMGWNGKLIDIKKLANNQLLQLINDELTQATIDSFKWYNISIKEARLKAYDIALKRKGVL